MMAEQQHFKMLKVNMPDGEILGFTSIFVAYNCGLVNIISC